MASMDRKQKFTVQLHGGPLDGRHVEVSGTTSHVRLSTIVDGQLRSVVYRCDDAIRKWVHMPNFGAPNQSHDE